MATAKKKPEALPPVKTTGKGSRQPVLKLPFVMPNGARIRIHPLLWLMKQYAEQQDSEWNKSELARRLGVRPQSLYKWERACKADRNFPLPVLRAKQFAGIFRVNPAIFRPDFPWSAE